MNPPRGRRSSLVGATAGMAVGTALSRVTGVIKLIVLVYAIGDQWFADGYNLANNTPNMIHDIVLGGVLSATFVPVFVDRLSTRKGPEAWRAISAVTTMTITLLAVASVVFWFAVPEIINIYTVANHTAQASQQRAEAVTLLKWFVPQLAFYGLISLFTALLNARRKFAMPMFVSVANNLVVIAALLWFHAVVGNLSLSAIARHEYFLAILGLGTTLGVVVQAVLLLPSLHRADLHIKFVWDPGHEAMRTIMRLAGWTFGLVLANQIALTIILALADGDRTTGSVSAYTYAYTFFQLPYGIVAVSIMSAVAPSLAERWALHDTAGFRRRMAYGLRGMLAIIIPATVGMLILSHVLSDLIFAHGATTTAGADTIGSTLAMFSLGLPGFCVFLYMTRVLQSMQDTRTAFYLYLVENVINVVVGLLLVGPLGRARPGLVPLDCLFRNRRAGRRRPAGPLGLAGGRPGRPADQAGGDRRVGGHGRGHRAGRERVERTNRFRGVRPCRAGHRRGADRLPGDRRPLGGAGGQEHRWARPPKHRRPTRANPPALTRPTTAGNREPFVVAGLAAIGDDVPWQTRSQETTVPTNWRHAEVRDRAGGRRGGCPWPGFGW